MKRLVQFTLLLALFSVVITSCKKYPEDDFSVRSPKWRLTRTWELDKIEDQNGNSMNTSGSASITYDKEGNYSGNVYGFAVSGTWKFSDSKDDLITTDDNGNEDTVAIIRLNKDELVVETDNNNRYYYNSK